MSGSISTLPARVLEQTELQALVAELAREPEAWLPLVRHEPGERVYEQLHHDEHVEVWVISWMQDHDTGYHDHDRSAGAFTAVRGEVVEERLVLGGPPATRRARAGEAIGFDASHIHRVRHDGGAPAVTIHAYSPPLGRLGSYVVDDDGTIRRETIGADEELRPQLSIAV
jgi:hypothetical protein